MFILNINITTVEYSMLRLNYTWITDHTNSKYGKDKILAFVALQMLLYFKATILTII